MTGALSRALLFASALAALLCLAACGGGGGGGSGGGSSPPTPTQNTQSIIVDGGPANVPNLAFTSVTICAPGSANCQTIDHVQVDTGSSGLRIIASVLSPGLSLPQQTDAGGNPVVECAQFADGFSWGPVKVADIRIAGEQASSVPIQVIGDGSFAAIPASCSASGPAENTVEAFGAKGLLGVGLFAQDCGSGCAQSAIPGTYYSCATSACQPIPLPLSQQLPNPVTMFGADNNGVVIQMQAIPDAGAISATGSLIFGIGTQSDNGLGSAIVLTTDPDAGTIVTTVNGQSFDNSYVDLGSSLFFFGIDSFPDCRGAGQGFYCPKTSQSLSATLRGANGRSASAGFTVGNADQLFANPSFNAFDDVAAPSGDTTTFAWGATFFYGRTVYTAIEQRQTPGGQGPYIAF